MRKGSKHSPDTREKIRQHNLLTGKKPPSQLGVKQSEETRRKRSEALKRIGHKPPSAKGLKRSDEFKRKVSENNARYWLGVRGEQSILWKGGLTEKNKLIRGSAEYRAWRKAVFIRDNFTCQNCDQYNGWLEADHIKPFSLYPELRFELSNGRTLCKGCHLSIGWRGSHVQKQTV